MSDKEKIEEWYKLWMITKDDYELLKWRLKAIEEINC